MECKAFKSIVGAAAAVLLTAAGVQAQQTVFLADNNQNREVWRGQTAGSQAGMSLDRGDVHFGDNRRDLIIGAPGWSSDTGRVYVLFGGPVRRGEVSLSEANAILTGGAVGDRFGTATAAGYISALEDGFSTRDLVVGAPEANTGGAVYMFLRGLGEGQRLSASDARITIVGAPAGARLGATLATGDVDGDGYREIIAGAPGIGRIYVIKGGPSVTGTIDLSVPSAAFFTILGSAPAGVGRSLAAGDLTGDGIYDVAIGAFNEGGIGAVYVLRGRTSNSFPSTMNLTTDASFVRFGGVDAGDFAGMSLDIAHFDNDVIADLLIGAPFAAGAANSRPQAGEIYVMWGAAALGSRSLADADLTIFGGIAGHREGSDIAMGDVDRQSPDDLVSLAPGASAAGNLHMILGRSRSAFTRTLDLAITPLDRRLIGDPSGPKIESALVYDLTGKGGDDVIAGVPGNQEGLVYISFSPLLEAILTYPAPGQTTVTTNRPFEWTPVDNAEMYRLTIGTSSGRTDLFDSGELTGTSVMVPPLPLGRTLFARVFTRIASAWRSSDSTFRIPVPSSFTFPIQGMSGVRAGFFSWSAVSGAEGYRLLLGSSVGASDYLDSGDLTQTSHRVFSLPQGQLVHARIMTKLPGAYAWNDITFTAASTAGGGADDPGAGRGANFGGDIGGDAFLYKPGSGPWSMQLSTTTGFTGVNSSLWAAGWTVKAGELNGDGLADLFLYHPSNGQWFKATSLGGGNFGFFGSTWAAGWDVTVLDLNGDGRSDVFLYNPVNGQWFRALNTGAGDFSYTGGFWAPGWTVYPADFNGDGRGDLFIYNRRAASDANSGRWFRVISGADGNFAYDGGTTRWANDWVITPADFNGDGLTDLFLYRPNGSWFRVIFVDGNPTFEGGLWGAGWTLHKADFNADGLADLFLYNPSNGQWFTVITERNGSLTYHPGTWATGWDISTTDFDNDGRTDLLLYNAATGQWFKALTNTPGSFTFQTGNWGTGWTVIARRTILP